MTSVRIQTGGVRVDCRAPFERKIRERGHVLVILADHRDGHITLCGLTLWQQDLGEVSFLVRFDFKDNDPFLAVIFWVLRQLCGGHLQMLIVVLGPMRE